MSGITTRLEFILHGTQEELLIAMGNLSSNNISITGISIIGKGDCLVTRIVTDNTYLTSRILHHADTKIVLDVPVPNDPGSLYRIFHMLTPEVQITASYIDESLHQIIEVDDVHRAIRLLSSTGVSVSE